MASDDGDSVSLSWAYVDESMRRLDSTTMHYLLAATVVAERHHEDVREALGPLARRTTQRVHWRDEEPPAKELIVKTVSSLDVESLVASGR